MDEQINSITEVPMNDRCINKTKPYDWYGLQIRLKKADPRPAVLTFRVFSLYPITGASSILYVSEMEGDVGTDPLLKRFKQVLKSAWLNVTIEPLVFVTFLIVFLSDISTQELYIQKACQVEVEENNITFGCIFCILFR